MVVEYHLVDEAGPLLRVEGPPQAEGRLAGGQSGARVLHRQLQPDLAVQKGKVVWLLVEGVVAHLGRLGEGLLSGEDEGEEVEAARVPLVDGQGALHLLLGAEQLTGLRQAHRQVEGVGDIAAVQLRGLLEVPQPAAVQLLTLVGDRLLLGEDPVAPPEEELGPGFQEVAPKALHRLGGPLHAEVRPLPFAHGKVRRRQEGQGVVRELADTLVEHGQRLLGLPVADEGKGKLGPEVGVGGGEGHGILETFHQGGMEVEVRERQGEEVEYHARGQRGVHRHHPCVDKGLGQHAHEKRLLREAGRHVTRSGYQAGYFRG